MHWHALKLRRDGRQAGRYSRRAFAHGPSVDAQRGPCTGSDGYVTSDVRKSERVRRGTTAGQRTTRTMNDDGDASIMSNERFASRVMYPNAAAIGLPTTEIRLRNGQGSGGSPVGCVRVRYDVTSRTTRRRVIPRTVAQ